MGWCCGERYEMGTISDPQLTWNTLGYHLTQSRVRFGFMSVFRRCISRIFLIQYSRSGNLAD